jgi:WD40 repeat protein
MAILDNENILKHIFLSYKLFNSKQASELLYNKIIITLIHKMLNYKTIFKSMGKAQIILGTHINNVSSFSILPDGNILSTDNKTLKLWNITNHVHIKTVNNETCANVLPNGVIISYSPFNRCIKIWKNYSDFFEINKYVYVEDCDKYNSVLLLSNGNLALAGEHKDTACVSILDCERGYKLLISLFYTYDNCFFSLVNLSFRQFASGSSHGYVRIWDGEYKCLKTFAAHKSLITSLIYYEKSNLLVSGSSDTTIKIWDLNGHQCITTIENKDKILCMLQLPFGLFASSYIGGFKIWDVNSYKCINTIKGFDNTVVTCLGLLKDDRIAFSASNMIIICYY